MYLKEKKSGDLVEVLDLQLLVNPNEDAVKGRFHAGEEMGDARSFAKAELCFPSNEALPECWVNPEYRA
ncbi:acetyltransferase [Candidatus Tenderia electrophaga]|jgi:hypothetical protein|uniref:Acetyltransferase n=1 Tax=Candidatus Tenderia electrophaga TaxID=1748243 RepID=A0A0S2TGC9_9GAMM|nr:acetyltransferase [Candidatus Tenderia electrophaga]